MTDGRSILEDAGFLGWEISELMGSPGWEEAQYSDFIRDFIDDRREWSGNLEDAGLTAEQIEALVDQFYEDEGYDTIWDWVRDAYKGSEG